MLCYLFSDFTKANLVLCLGCSRTTFARQIKIEVSSKWYARSTSVSHCPKQNSQFEIF